MYILVVIFLFFGQLLFIVRYDSLLSFLAIYTIWIYFIESTFLNQLKGKLGVVHDIFNALFLLISSCPSSLPISIKLRVSNRDFGMSTYTNVWVLNTQS